MRDLVVLNVIHCDFFLGKSLFLPFFIFAEMAEIVFLRRFLSEWKRCRFLLAVTGLFIFLFGRRSIGFFWWSVEFFSERKISRFLLFHQFCNLFFFVYRVIIHFFLRWNWNFLSWNPNFAITEKKRDWLLLSWSVPSFKGFFFDFTELPSFYWVFRRIESGNRTIVPSNRRFISFLFSFPLSFFLSFFLSFILSFLVCFVFHFFRPTRMFCGRLSTRSNRRWAKN